MVATVAGIADRLAGQLKVPLVLPTVLTVTGVPGAGLRSRDW